MKITLHGFIRTVEAVPVSNVHLYTSQQRNTHQNKVCNIYNFIYYNVIFGETVYLITFLVNPTNGPVFKPIAAYFNNRVIDCSWKNCLHWMYLRWVLGNRCSNVNCIYLAECMTHIMCWVSQKTAVFEESHVNTISTCAQ